MNKPKVPPAPVGYAAARLTHPTARLLSGHLWLPDVEVKLCKELP
ncbi:hypothetical protein [Crenobacter caeni]|nr:hypothetical protein [Crenobacter caeni]